MCRFRVNGRPIRRIFHRFQNVPASCERSLNQEKSTDNSSKFDRNKKLLFRSLVLIVYINNVYKYLKFFVDCFDCVRT